MAQSDRSSIAGGLQVETWSRNMALVHRFAQVLGVQGTWVVEDKYSRTGVVDPEHPGPGPGIGAL